MKSSFKYYFVIWAALLVVFNIIVFVVPAEIGGVNRFEGGFWVGYIFIMLTYVGQLATTWFSVKDGLQKTFYRLPLLTISYVTMAAMLIVGLLCMIIPPFPAWLGIILCLIILVFGIVALMQAQAAASLVEGTDAKVKVQTLFIKSLTVDLDSLMARCESPEIKNCVKEVYEAVRYSDPMSNDALAGVESQITIKINELSENVEKADLEAVKKSAKEAGILINERNKKCKMLK